LLYSGRGIANADFHPSLFNMTIIGKGKTMKQTYWNRRMSRSCLIFLSLLVVLSSSVVTARNEIYEVKADDLRGSSLRGDSFRRHRTSSHKQQESNERSLFNRWRPRSKDVPDMPDPTTIGLIENRRFSAMETMFRAEKLMYTLRFSMSLNMSMGMSMSMSMPSVCWLSRVCDIN